MPPRKRQPASQTEIRCPRCQSDQPSFEMVPLTTDRVEDGRVVSERTGCVKSCQCCGHVYAIGPHGIFQRDRTALPLTPLVDAPRVGPPAPEDEETAPPVRSLLPTPLRRPSV